MKQYKQIELSVIRLRQDVVTGSNDRMQLNNHTPDVNDWSNQFAPDRFFDEDDDY